MTTSPPRIRAPEAANRLGVSLRVAQRMSAQGLIPGAALIGGQYSYDSAKLDKFIADREAELCRNGGKKISISAAEKLGGYAIPQRTTESAKAYAQAMSNLLGRSETNG